ncbi:hypothetical protein ID866_7340 [Astraeus odoratus]|nr:hypothetical protein ID866_7340 [Astraeus odoratus]
MVSAPTRSTIFRLINAAQHTACPCHGCRAVNHTHAPLAFHQLRKLATPVNAIEKEYAFEVLPGCRPIMFGEGVTREVGMDLKNLKARKVGVFTDPVVAKLKPMQTAIESLQSQQDLPFEIFDQVVTEPTEESWQRAIDWARKHDFSHFLAVGGGSVIDTAKAANLFTVYKDADLMNFVNAPVGKGLPIDKSLRPLIAVPTTAGTGSETTGAAIFDVTSRAFKTGIANRALKPVLGIVDTANTETCPTEVHISAGLDVLFHSLESYTAIPLAASFAGIGFGNAGVHLCHGMSYPISGLNKRGPKYKHPGYEVEHPIIPHGISVALTGPAVFQFTAPSSPDRHREALAIFNSTTVTDPSITSIPDSEIGAHLYESIARFLDGLDVPRGLRAVGYTKDDVPKLVDGTIPQRRVLDLAPNIGDVAGEDGREHLTRILEASMEY